MPSWILVGGAVAALLVGLVLSLSTLIRVIGGIGVRRPNLAALLPKGPAPPALVEGSSGACELLNSRDVAHAASRTVRLRAGALFRGGVPSGEGVVGHLAADRGVRTIVDLRGAEEAAHDTYNVVDGVTRVECPAVEKASAYERFSLLSVILFRRAAIPSLLGKIYWALVAAHPAELGAALRVLAEAKNFPVYLHCSIGKDRTGIVVATALALAGVPDEDILHDYAMTNYAHEGIHKAFVDAAGEKAESRGIPAEEMRGMWIADPKWVIDALAHMRAKHGSVQNYVAKECGLDFVEIAAIRANLVAAETT
jgi:protein-tyrosine phosphatase